MGRLYRGISPVFFVLKTRNTPTLCRQCHRPALPLKYEVISPTTPSNCVYGVRGYKHGLKAQIEGAGETLSGGGCWCGGDGGAIAYGVGADAAGAVVAGRVRCGGVACLPALPALPACGGGGGGGGGAVHPIALGDFLIVTPHNS